MGDSGIGRANSWSVNIAKLKTFLGISWRLAITLAVIGIVVVFAWMVAEWIGPSLSDSQIKKYGGAYIAGAGFFLMLLKESIPLLPKLWDYIRTGAGKGLYDVSSFAFLAFLGLAISALGVGQNVGVTPSPPSSVPSHMMLLRTEDKVTQHVVLLQTGDEDRSIPVFIIPFPQEATLDESNEFQDGLTINQSGKEFIEDLAHGLRACATEDNIPQIRVKGFDSSSLFGKKDERESNSYNLRLANLRAEKVVDTFKQVECEIESGEFQSGECNLEVPAKLDIVAFDWKKFVDMEEARGFSDRKEGGFSSERGLLNRRAEIHIVDAAGCRIIKY